MGSSAQPLLRIPLILLAIADLAMLGSRLWPWQDVVSTLPLNGATGIDPVVCLLAYIGISGASAAVPVYTPDQARLILRAAMK